MCKPLCMFPDTSESVFHVCILACCMCKPLCMFPDTAVFHVYTRLPLFVQLSLVLRSSVLQYCSLGEVLVNQCASEGSNTTSTSSTPARVSAITEVVPQDITPSHATGVVPQEQSVSVFLCVWISHRISFSFHSCRFWMLHHLV